MFEFYIFLSFVFILILTIVIAYWRCNSCEFPKIKYRNFLKYYKLNPERWYCGLDTVRYEMSDGSGELFNFGLIGFYRYKLLKYRLAKAKRRKEYAEIMQRFLDDVNKTEGENVSE